MLPRIIDKTEREKKKRKTTLLGEKERKRSRNNQRRREKLSFSHLRFEDRGREGGWSGDWWGLTGKAPNILPSCLLARMPERGRRESVV